MQQRVSSVVAFYQMVGEGLSEDVLFKPISEGQEQAANGNAGAEHLRHSEHDSLSEGGPGGLCGGSITFRGVMRRPESLVGHGREFGFHSRLFGSH